MYHLEAKCSYHECQEIQEENIKVFMEYMFFGINNKKMIIFLAQFLFGNPWRIHLICICSLISSRYLSILYCRDAYQISTLNQTKEFVKKISIQT
jgi:hypothetical protein